MNKSFVEFGQLTEEIPEREEVFRLQFRGRSMYPFLKDGEIILVKLVASAEIRRADIILYRNPDGKTVVHRMIKKKKRKGGTVFLTRGDAWIYKTIESVNPDEILGKAIAVDRKGKVKGLEGFLPKLIALTYHRLQFISRLFPVLKGIAKLFDPALWIPNSSRSLRSVAQKYNTREAVDAFSQEVAKGLQPAEREIVERFMRLGGRILDLGCGTGREAIAFAKMGYKVVGIDIASNMIARAREFAKKEGLDIKFELKDATSLDYLSHSFDYAFFSRQSYSHIPSRRLRVEMLKSLRRILKEDGIFVFSCHYHPKKFFSRLTVMDAMRRLFRLFGLGKWISEPGDVMIKGIGSPAELNRACFWHYFSDRQEVLEEIKMGGFKDISPRDTFFWVVKPDYEGENETLTLKGRKIRGKNGPSRIF